VNPEKDVLSGKMEQYAPCARYSRLGVTLEQFKDEKNPGLLRGIKYLHMHALCEQGFEEFREHPYQDLDGGMLIGYGHQMLAHEQYLTLITRENAELLLQQDILKAERCLGQLIDFDLTQNQFDALVSFIYSTGCARFQCSSVYVYLKRRDFKNALLQWKRWILPIQNEKNILQSFQEFDEDVLFYECTF
jgi:lysozyme